MVLGIEWESDPGPTGAGVLAGFCHGLGVEREGQGGVTDDLSFLHLDWSGGGGHRSQSAFEEQSRVWF